MKGVWGRRGLFTREGGGGRKERLKHLWSLATLLRQVALLPFGVQPEESSSVGGRFPGDV